MFVLWVGRFLIAQQLFTVALFFQNLAKIANNVGI
jgi:hypothetical protein